MDQDYLENSKVNDDDCTRALRLFGASKISGKIVADREERLSPLFNEKAGTYERNDRLDAWRAQKSHNNLGVRPRIPYMKYLGDKERKGKAS